MLLKSMNLRSFCFLQSVYWTAPRPQTPDPFWPGGGQEVWVRSVKPPAGFGMEESHSFITGYGGSASTVANQSSTLAVYEIYRQTRRLPPFEDSVREVFYSPEFFKKFPFYFKDKKNEEWISCIESGVVKLNPIIRLGICSNLSYYP